MKLDYSKPSDPTRRAFLTLCYPGINAKCDGGKFDMSRQAVSKLLKYTGMRMIKLSRLDREIY